MRTQLVKVARIREAGVPVGQPARMFLNCPCGVRPEQTEPQTVCQCGRIYDPSGYLINSGMKPTTQEREDVMSAHTPGPLNPVEGERMHPRTETPYTLNLAFATKEERATASRLIAAATETAAERDRLKEINRELLEALELAEKQLRQWHFRTKPASKVDVRVQEALDKARAAIAKVKGERT